MENFESASEKVAIETQEKMVTGLTPEEIEELYDYLGPEDFTLVVDRFFIDKDGDQRWSDGYSIEHTKGSEKLVESGDVYRAGSREETWRSEDLRSFAQSQLGCALYLAMKKHTLAAIEGFSLASIGSNLDSISVKLKADAEDEDEDGNTELLYSHNGSTITEVDKIIDGWEDAQREREVEWEEENKKEE